MKNNEQAPTPPPTIKQVQDRLEEISSHRALLVQSRISLDQRLESAQEETARKYLRGDRSGLQEVNAITAELQAIEGALSLLNGDEQIAQIELKRAEARDLRSQATTKRAALDRLNAETAALLAKLSELEEVGYTHSILSSQPLPGMWHGKLTVKPPAPYLGLAELDLQSYTGPAIGSPRSRLLLAEVEELEAKARQIEQKLPPAA
jgi:transposase